MNETTRSCMIAAAIVLVIGLLFAGLIFYISGLQYFPSLLADIYREDRIDLSVPGSKEVYLNRVGAYGIYFQYSLLADSVETNHIPPALECLLKSESGQSIRGVDDYEPSNRYWSKKSGGPATLIQSVRIDEPGAYSFECSYRENNKGEGVQVSLGPNYTWELIRLVLKFGLGIAGIILTLGGSILVSAILFLAGMFHFNEKNLEGYTDESSIN